MADPYDDPAVYPQGGKTSADLYTPVYFAVTWAIGRGIQAATGLDLLTGARLSGFLWLAAGMWLFSRIMSRFRAPSIVTFGLGLAYIASPIASWSYTYISTDAPSFLVGAALLLAAFRFVRGEGSGWWLVPIAVLGVWLKVANIVAVGMILVFLILYALSRWKTADKLASGVTRARLIVTGMIFTVSSLAAEVIWIVIRELIKVGTAPNQGVSEALNFRTIGHTIQVFLPGPFSFLVGPVNNPDFLAVPLGWLVIAGVFGAFFVVKRWGMNRSFITALAIAATLFPPILLVGTSIVSGEALPISSRYGAVLIAPMFLAVAYILRNRLSQWLLFSYGVLVFVAILAYAVNQFVFHHF